VLSGAIFVPGIGAALLLLIPAAEETVIKVVSLLASLVAMGLGIYVFAHFNYNHTSVLQMSVNRNLIDVIHARYHVGVDGISLPLMGLTLLIVPCASSTAGTISPSPTTPRRS
jgi:NADH-quinone oxidoreductase subunit M